MKRKILIIAIIVVLLIVGFTPYRYKKNDLDVVRRNEVDSEVSCYYSLVFQYSYTYIGRYNLQSGIGMHTRYTIFGFIVVEEHGEKMMLSSDGMELIPYEKPVAVSSI